MERITSGEEKAEALMWMIEQRQEDANIGQGALIVMQVTVPDCAPLSEGYYLAHNTYDPDLCTVEFTDSKTRAVEAIRFRAEACLA